MYANGILGIKEKFNRVLKKSLKIILIIYINIYIQNQLKMKEIAIKNEVVNLSNINDDDFVGILWRGGGKSKIIRLAEGFVGFSLLNHDLRSHWLKKSKKEYLENALTQIGSRAYAFDSSEELLKWLLK